MRSGPDTGGAKKIVPSKQWKMQMYLSAQPLYNMPLDLSGLQLLGKEVKVGSRKRAICPW